jgi:4-diphosphocytidyl-2-C-methyl-D-erythritol kinase
MPAASEIAYAKINLALHVRRRRDDGYHELETLFAFAEDGDRLTVTPADEDRLTISGEFAAGLTTGPDNLVLKALASFRKSLRAGQRKVPPLAIHLEKKLPVASGIGGGSADAAALIRLVERHFQSGSDNQTLLRAHLHLGADVGACIVSQTQIGLGTGDDLHIVDADELKSKPLLLVNPRIPLLTAQVFAGWDGIDRGPLPDVPASHIAFAGRNDLQPPAIALVPEIGDILTLLEEQNGSELVRMSGSGATCFAIFSTTEARDAARDRIGKACPRYWMMASSIR